MEVEQEDPNPQPRMFTVGQRCYQLQQQLNIVMPGAMVMVNGNALTRIVSFLAQLELHSLAVCVAHRRLCTAPHDETLGEEFFGQLVGLQQIAATSLGLKVGPSEETPPPKSNLIVP